jgi:nitroimidazol reductase NimA-like FMN-containing flavoprotein (pyridoxamine 5'-phosphate oxidase superfamily)
MFRKMRRSRQQLSTAETIQILESATSGVLAVSGDEGYPYAVPLSHVLKGDRLFFHVAKEGHKLDGIQRNDRVSFCVIAQDQVMPSTFSTRYRSAIVFGRARLLTEDSERRYALECLVEKYSPGFIEEGQLEIESAWDRVCLVEVKIEHMTGKTAKELVENSPGAS